MTHPVAKDELLARYIVFSKWIHKQDYSVRQDAFIPPSNNLKLSVTRHWKLTETNIWSIGKAVAQKRERTLYGRADVATYHVSAQKLNVEPQPMQDNPNHANITGWPTEKDSIKMYALEIARCARFIANPEAE
ncbi:MAG: hypothetical protein ABIH42_04695 [Planctomycetota bacterium]